VEAALAEGARLRRRAGRAAEAADAAAGIDAFELTLKRIGGGEDGEEGNGGNAAQRPPLPPLAKGGAGGALHADAAGDTAGGAEREGPTATLARLRAYAPAAASLADGSGAYLACIRARRRDEAAARRERAVRRRRLVVEAAGARRAAEDAEEAGALVDLVAAQGAQEAALAARLWRLRQEEGAMREARLLREAAYAEARARGAVADAAREAALARWVAGGAGCLRAGAPRGGAAGGPSASCARTRVERGWPKQLPPTRARAAPLPRREMADEHCEAVARELEARAAARAAEAAAKAGRRRAAAADAVWRLVRLTDRVVEHRAATGGAPLARKDWRAWVALFVGEAGGAELAAPLVPEPVELAGPAAGPGEPAAGAALDGDSATADSGAGARREEAPGVAALLNAAEVNDYLLQTGAWEPAAAAGDAAVSASSGASTSRGPTGLRRSHAASVAEGTGEGASARGAAVNDAAAAAAAAAQLAEAQQQQAVAAQLGRVVAGLAAAAKAAEAAAPAAAEGAPGAAGRGGLPTLDHALRLAVVGPPLSGKSTVAAALAQQHGLKVLEPGALVAQALAAAQAWEAEQRMREEPGEGAAGAEAQPGDGAAAALPGAATALPPKVALGQRLAAALAAGGAAPDDLLVEAAVLGIEEARTYTAPRPDGTPPGEAGGGGGRAAKGSSAGGRAAASAAAQRGGGTGGGGAGAGGGWPAASGQGPVFPGGPGNGFVLDGFPATAAQAAALERALTGLDLEAEAGLLERASRLAPPPPDALPQLGRPLASGLDAVVALEGVGDAAAVARALGRRVDPLTGELGWGELWNGVTLQHTSQPARHQPLLPTPPCSHWRAHARGMQPSHPRASTRATGAVYHQEHAPPPSNVPGLTERLVAPGAPANGSSADADAPGPRALVGPHLAAAAEEGPALAAWLRRFGTLLRPVDGGAAIPEAATAACGVAASVLRSKAAARAAAGAAELAAAAREGAEATQAWAAVAREHAEAAARELLAVKRAEASALALVTGAKAPDPAAAEVLKAQAAGKCAEQLRACCAAAAEARGLAERSAASADAATQAARRCRLAVGDAAASAEAEAAAKCSGAGRVE
jgi:hypothetical protein